MDTEGLGTCTEAPQVRTRRLREKGNCSISQFALRERDIMEQAAYDV